MRAIDKIRSLINELPEKDISLGFKFADERDFDSLQELVDSAIVKTRRSQASEVTKPEYANINLLELNKLKAEVDNYIDLLTIPEQEEEDYLKDDFSDVGGMFNDY